MARRRGTRGAPGPAGASAAAVLTTRGDMIRGGVGGAAERLGLGAAGQVLTSDGTDATWAAASGGAAGLTWRGAYAGGTTYALNDAVTSGGASYRSLAAGNVGNAPASSPASWEVLAAAGAAGPAPTGTGPVEVSGDVLVNPARSLAVFASDVGTALGVPQPVTYTAASAGWTLMDATVGAGTATAVGDVIRLTKTGAAAARWDFGGWIEGSYAWRALPSALRYRVAMRVPDSAAYAANAVRMNLAVRNEASTTVGNNISVHPDGSAETLTHNAAAVGAGIGSGIPVDGTGWVMLERVGFTFAYYYGTGTLTTPPTIWTYAASLSTTTIYTRLVVSLGVYDASTPTLDFGPVIVLDEGPSL